MRERESDAGCRKTLIYLIFFVTTGYAPFLYSSSYCVSCAVVAVVAVAAAVGDWGAAGGGSAPPAGLSCRLTTVWAGGSCEWGIRELERGREGQSSRAR